MYRALLLLLPLLAFPSLTQETCSSCVDQDGDGYCADGTLPDCDDTSSSVHPDADEVCGDSIDQDCDGQDQAIHTYYRDSDGDGYGVEADARVACNSPSGYAPLRGDCGDADPATHPFALEASSRDGKDQDCGGTDGRSPSVAGPTASIQSALDVAVNGQTIWVGPGTYLEHDLDFKGKQVTLISTGGQERTVIDAQMLGRGFSFHTGETKASSLDGFVVRNGYITSDGGGMLLDASSPTLTNLAIEGNHANSRGGGMFLDNGSSPALTNLTITGNQTDGDGGYGGGMCLSSSSSLLTNVTIKGNQADYGGGICLFHSGSTLSRVTIAGNRANDQGGGMFLWSSFPTLTNVTMAGNRANDEGGGMYLFSYSSLELTNVTIVGNAGWGGGMYLDGSSSRPILENVLLAFNAPYNLLSYGEVPTLTWSDLYNPPDLDNHNLESLDATNLTIDPAFVRYSTDSNPDNDDLHLRPGSPLLNAGDPSLLDPDGSRSDIGVFGGPGAEFAYYADANGDGLYDGWETANGVEDAGGDTDWDGLSNADEFAAGTDPQQADTDGDGAADGTELSAGSNALDWYSRPGAPEVVADVPGDFPTIQAAIDAGWGEARIEVEPGTYQESLMIDGKSVSLWSTGGASVTTLMGDGGSVVETYRGSLELRGFTVTGGDAGYGGGVWLYGSEGVLEDVVMTGNHASLGGGIHLDSSSAKLTNVTIEGNQADYWGGGMSLSGSSPALTNVTIAGNQSFEGGGMSLFSSNPTLANVTIAENQANYYGGGMYLSSSSPTLTNVTLAGNQADAGGGMYLQSSSPRLTNVIAACNTGYNLYQLSSSPGVPTFNYVILYAPAGQLNYYNIIPSATTWTWEPGFLTYGTAGQPTDLHLATTSQAVNAGDPGIIDPDGSRSDIGAYGGPGAGGYDLDGDGFPDWFWPGTIDQPPSGFSRSSYDADDRDPAVH